MHIPDWLRAAIEKRVEETGLREVQRAAQKLSERYRSGDVTAGGAVEAVAYLATRFPATYGAAHRVLSGFGGAGIATIVDWGAGPGTASLAARALLGDVAVALIEPNRALAAEAARLLPSARFLTAAAPADLVVFCYSLSEMRDRTTLLQAAWRSAAKALVIIEPGTPSGFEVVREARQLLISWGASIAAPCPSDAPCPIAAGDWCHFAQRIERSKIHRLLKGGELSWEDEKFSYVAAVRSPVVTAPGRVLRHPRKETGRIELTVCQGTGIELSTVSRRDPLFKAARKAEWGDAWPPPAIE
jgi:ribosomal protein RSM22 (predicted rRNA methylase)